MHMKHIDIYIYIYIYIKGNLNVMYINKYYIYKLYITL